MEKKAVLWPQQPERALSARPSRPRSAENRAAAADDAQRPTTSESGRRRIAGYEFPAGSSPRPEVLAASRRQQQLPSALELSRRQRDPLVDPVAADELLPPLSGMPFQASSKDSQWFGGDGAPSAAWSAVGMEGLPPPQRPPSAAPSFAEGVAANAPTPRPSTAGEGVGAFFGTTCGSGGDGTTPAQAAGQAAAVEERTAFLTKLFQERLAKQLCAAARLPRRAAARRAAPRCACYVYGCCRHAH